METQHSAPSSGDPLKTVYKSAPPRGKMAVL